MSNAASTSSTEPERSDTYESFALLMDSMRGISLKEPKEAQPAQQSKKSKKKKKGKSKVTAANKPLPESEPESESEPEPAPARVPSAAAPEATSPLSDDVIRKAVHAFPVEEGIWQRTQRGASDATASSSSGGYGVSAGSVQKLMSLDTAISGLVKVDIEPLARLQFLLFTDFMMISDRMFRSRTEATMTQAIDELDEATLELLPPPLQVLKRGVDEMASPHIEYRRVERRINALLRAAGEAEVEMPNVKDRMDRSLPIPTRVRKTDEEKKEQRKELESRLKDLKLRKRELHDAILQIMKEHKAKSEARAKEDAEAREKAKAKESAQVDKGFGSSADVKEDESGKTVQESNEVGKESVEAQQS